MSRGRRRTALMVVLALVVVATFLLRRVGVTPGTGTFAPEDYRDVPAVSAPQAGDLVGTRATVCGRVEEATFAVHVGGEPTFLNLDGRHPDQPFTAVIWGRDRRTFAEPPEEFYRNRRICVSGRVRLHQGTPQIEVTTPAQIELRQGG